MSEAIVDNSGQEQVLDNQNLAADATTEVSDVSNWRDSLSDDFRDHKSLRNINSIDDMAKSFINAQSVIGRRFEDLSPEQLNEFYVKTGRPENAEGYNFELGDTADPDMVNWFKNAAFEAGLTEANAQKIMDSYNEKALAYQSEFNAVQELEAAESIKELKNDFGLAYDQKVESARRAVTEFGGQELKDVLDQTGLGNNPTIVKAFAQVGEYLSEDKLVKPEQKTSGVMTPEEAKLRINELRSDPEFQQLERLYQLAYTR
jgi:hypothetical protein